MDWRIRCAPRLWETPFFVGIESMTLVFGARVRPHLVASRPLLGGRSRSIVGC